jgi:hypothetical protein
MSKVAKQILQRFSPFENHKDSNSNTYIVNDVYEFNYKIQDTVFQIISSDNNNKLLFQLSLLLTKKFNSIELNNQELLKFIIFCKNLIQNIKTNYIGYTIDYKKLVCKDIYTLITRKKILNFIINEMNNSDKLRTIILTALSKLFKFNKNIDIKYKKLIISKIIMKQIAIGEEFNRINLINIQKKSNPFIKTDDEKLLVQYVYLEYYVRLNNQLQNKKKFMNYEFILKNFNDIFETNNRIIYHLKNNIFETFLNIIQIGFNDINYINDSLLIIIGYMCNTIKQLFNSDPETKVYYHYFLFSYMILIDENFIKYCNFIIHSGITNKKEFHYFEKLFNTIKTLFDFSFILNEGPVKNLQILGKLIRKHKIDIDKMLKWRHNKVKQNYKLNLLKLFGNEYCKYMITRFQLNKNFNIDNEEVYVNYINKLVIEDNGKLELTLNDIKVSQLCNSNIQNLNIVLKDENKHIPFDKKKLSYLYQTNFTCNNSSYLKNKIDNKELQLYLKLAKQSFKESVYKHDTIVEISDVYGYYDYNVMFFNKELRIISNLREYNILNCLKNYLYTSFEEIQSYTSIDIYECKKTLIKLEYVGIVNAKKNKFKLNEDFNKKKINLFNYNFNIIVNKNKEEEKEKTDIEKIIITQTYIVKEIKPQSNIQLRAMDVYASVLDKVSKYIELDEKIFIKSMIALYNKDTLTFHKMKRHCDCESCKNKPKPQTMITLTYHDDEIDSKISSDYKKKLLYLQYEV